ncbi:MAG TPA: VWA domain-containing protein [Verrucomicrobiae bacterium]|jgi:Ca-activated chloride channel family protein|nr:VWA domain-containing protein [Verrucomicrobiae bacterium]
MDLRHPHFAEPAWLWLAVLAPLALVALQRYAGWARTRQLGLFAAPELLADLLRSHSPVRRIVKNIFLVVAIAGMGVALARPQWGETTEVSTTLGEDILFVVDCSRSMLATDVAPNRLTRAKYAILDFVQKHGRGRMGLVAFSGQAFLQCPLTFDYDAFREALLSLDDKTIPVPGTDIGRALDEGFRAMEKNERRKIMILVTDGEDLEKSGVAEAKSLSEKGVVIYTIGVGTPSGSPIQIVTDQNKLDYVRDGSGNIVQSHLDENTLTEIAEATHGTYQPLGSLGEGFNRVRHLVETSMSSADYSRARKLGVDRYYFPVAAIIFLIVAESLVGTRRKVAEDRSDKL